MVNTHTTQYKEGMILEEMSRIECIVGLQNPSPHKHDAYSPESRRDLSPRNLYPVFHRQNIILWVN